MRASVLLVMAALLWPSAGRTQETVHFEPLERAVLSELQTRQIPGIAIAVVSNGTIVFQKGFGVLNADTEQPVTPDSIFPAASVTKMFTSTALVTLADGMKIDLHAPIGHYLRGLSPKLAALTVHQLLSHTAGLQQGWRAGVGTSSSMPSLRALATSLDDDYVFAPPGDVFSYSNPGFALAGAVIEAASGKLYTEHMADVVFRPLQMRRTTYDPAVIMTFPFSQGHAGPPGTKAAVRRPYDLVPLHTAPGAGMYSTVQDLARFAIAFMAGGNADDRQVLPASIVRKVATPYTRFNPLPNGGDYGYGVRIYSHRGLRVIEHGGIHPGAGSLLYMVPGKRFAVIILANRTAGGRLYDVVDVAIDLLLDAGPKPGGPRESEVSIEPAEMERLRGRYVNGATVVELDVTDGQLLFRTGDAARPIAKIGAYEFAAGLGTPIETRFRILPGRTGDPEYLYFTGMLAQRKQVK